MRLLTTTESSPKSSLALFAELPQGNVWSCLCMGAGELWNCGGGGGKIVILLFIYVFIETKDGSEEVAAVTNSRLSIKCLAQIKQGKHSSVLLSDHCTSDSQRGAELFFTHTRKASFCVPRNCITQNNFFLSSFLAFLGTLRMVHATSLWIFVSEKWKALSQNILVTWLSQNTDSSSSNS